MKKIFDRQIYLGCAFVCAECDPRTGTSEGEIKFETTEEDQESLSGAGREEETGGRRWLAAETESVGG